jgi:hypothetical protein
MPGVLLDVNPSGTLPGTSLKPIQKGWKKNGIVLKQPLTFAGASL